MHIFNYYRLEQISISTCYIIDVTSCYTTCYTKITILYYSSWHVTTDAESVNLERDLGIRKVMKLTEKEKQFLICQGPYQPRSKKYPINAAISKTNQNAFNPK
jgi:hypothetical protein